MRTQDAQNIHINDYLNRIGARFARTQNGTNGLEYVYHSPIREDRDPSLCVNFDRNIWYDAPSQRGGRLIELVCYLNELPEKDVSGALKILDQIFFQYRGSGHRSVSQSHSSLAHAIPRESKKAPPTAPPNLKKKAKGRELIAEREIYWYPLKSYLEERKIPLDLAKIYLKEVEYRSEQRVYKALGWKAGDTYVLRNKHFKGFLDTGAQVTVIDQKSTELLVFEGFFDFLSYLVIQKWQKSPLTVVVLNSTAMYPQLKRLLVQSSNIERLSCYLDRDEAGRSLMEKIESDFGSRMIVSDCSSLYKKFHDINEMLVSS